MELESSTQNQNNKLSASVVPTFTKNVKVGHPSFPFPSSEIILGLVRNSGSRSP